MKKKIFLLTVLLALSISNSSFAEVKYHFSGWREDGHIYCSAYIKETDRVIELGIDNLEKQYIVFDKK